MPFYPGLMSHNLAKENFRIPYAIKDAMQRFNSISHEPVSAVSKYSAIEKFSHLDLNIVDSPSIKLSIQKRVLKERGAL